MVVGSPSRNEDRGHETERGDGEERYENHLDERAVEDNTQAANGHGGCSRSRSGPAVQRSGHSSEGRSDGDHDRQTGHDQRCKSGELGRRRHPEQHSGRCGDEQDAPGGRARGGFAGSGISPQRSEELHRCQHRRGHEQGGPALGAVEVRVLDLQHRESRQKRREHAHPTVEQPSPQQVHDSDRRRVGHGGQEAADEVGVVAVVEGVDPCRPALGVEPVIAKVDPNAVREGHDRPRREGAVGEETGYGLGGE